MNLNIPFPGRANYTGPLAGYFTFVHHGVLFEYSHNIQERVTYILERKPKYERATRLRHLMWLDPARVDLSEYERMLDSYKKVLNDYRKVQNKCSNLWGEPSDFLVERGGVCWKYHTACSEASPRVLKYVIERMPKHKWNGRTLVFPRAL